MKKMKGVKVAVLCSLLGSAGMAFSSERAAQTIDEETARQILSVLVPKESDREFIENYANKSVDELGPAQKEKLQSLLNEVIDSVKRGDTFP